MKIIIESKFEQNDEVFLQAYGIGSYRKERICEVAVTRDNKSFTYRIPSHPFLCDSFNWILEKDMFSSLSRLQDKWRKDILTPKEY